MKLIFLLLVSLETYAYIPPTKMILQRLVENSGTGTYIIEQEVQFSVGLEPLLLRETWVIENEKNMKLTVSTSKDSKDLFQMQAIYSNGQKWILKGKSREGQQISADFLEKFFHYRSVDSVTSQFRQMGLFQSPEKIPEKQPENKKPPKSNDIKYEQDPSVRLGRIDGVIAYTFGIPTPSTQSELNAGLWIEQDQFVLRKLRLSNQVELTAENFGNFQKGLIFPKNRQIRWNNNIVQIRLLSISSRNNLSASFFQPTNLDVSYSSEKLMGNSVKEVVEEFYSRFR